MAFLSSCGTQYRNSQGFGGSNFQGEKTTNNQLNHTLAIPTSTLNAEYLDTAISVSANVEKLKPSVFSDSQFNMVPVSSNWKNEQKSIAIEQIQGKSGVKKVLKNIGKHIAKVSFYSSLIGLLSSKLLVFSVLAILLGILATTVSSGIRVKFWAYLGIILGVLGLISPALNAILAILILVALILILMKLMHWY